MKSVSFSDLRLAEQQQQNSNQNYNRTLPPRKSRQEEQFSSEDEFNGNRTMSKFPDSEDNSNSSSMLPVSSYFSAKTLTHYKSSEDILKRYPTKFTADRNSYFETDINKSSKIGSEDNHENPLADKVITQNGYESEDITGPYDKDQFIRDLKQQLEMKDGSISRVQEENIELKTDRDKMADQVGILEKRISYLEHMLAAFTSDVKPAQVAAHSNWNEKENVPNGNTASSGLNSRSSKFGNKFEPQREPNYSNKIEELSKSDYRPLNIDLNVRPTSADSLFVQSATVSPMTRGGGRDERSSYNYKHISSTKPYDSDSDDRLRREESCDYSKQQQTSMSDLASWQRKKIDKDRTVNLSEFKTRLDEFTKYARHTAERNSLSSSSQTSFNQIPEGHSSSNHGQSRGRDEVYTRYSTNPRPNMGSNLEQRPPPNPYHRARRFQPSSGHNARHSHHDAPSNSNSTLYDSMSQEDENLKERVKRILEKHQFPEHEQKSYNSSGLHGSADYGPDFRYGNISLDGDGGYVPRLDLSRESNAVLDPETNELLAKYLTYPDYQPVS